MFPRSFYRSGNNVQLEMTAVPTGMLLNPLDLVNSARPWVKISNQANQYSTQKKWLIFADHLFKFRLCADKQAIINQLRSAIEAGFQILSINSNGQLIEFDRKTVNYCSIPLADLTREHILALVWAQKSIAADEVFLLDYCGINELQGKDRNQIDAFVYMSNPDNFYRLLENSKLNSLCINIDSIPATERFLALDLNLLEPYAKKITQLNFSNCSPPPEYEMLLETWPNCKSITYNKCHDVLYMLNNLENPKLNIKEVTLVNDRVETEWVFVSFFSRAGSKLERIAVLDSNPIGPTLETHVDGLAKNLTKYKQSYASLRNIILPDSDLGPDGLAHFLHYSAPLEELDLSHCTNPALAAVLEQYFDEKLSTLRKLNLENVPLSRELVGKIARSTHLQELNLNSKHWPEGLNSAMLSEQSNALSSLSTLRITQTSLRKEMGVPELIISAINVETLEVFGLDFLIPMAAQGQRLTKLHSLHVHNAGVGEFVDLVTMAPNLVELTADRGFCFMAPPSKKAISAKKLERLSLGHLHIQSGDEMESLIAVTPHLHFLSLTQSKIAKFSSSLIAWPELNEMILSSIRFSTLTELETLINGCQKLNNLSLANCALIDETPPTLTNPFVLTSVTENTIKSNVSKLALSSMHLYSTNNPPMISSDGQICMSMQNVLYGNTKLEELYLENISFGNMGQQQIKIPNIRSLSISGNCSDFDENFFLGTSNLETLSLLDTNIKTLSFRQYTTLPRLRRLIITGNVDPFYFRRIIAIAPYLEEISFQGSNVDVILARLQPYHVKNLRTVILNNPSPATLARVMELAPQAVITGNLSAEDHEIIQYQKVSIKQTLPSISNLNHVRTLGKNFFSTANDKPTLSFVRYFTHIEPDQYRLRTSRPDLKSLQMDVPVADEHFKNIPLSSKNYDNDQSYRCEPGFRPSESKNESVILLPSLDAEENVFGIQVMDQQNQLVNPKHWRLQHSDFDDLHRIVFDQPGCYSIAFKVAITLDRPRLPMDLQVLQNDYRAFKPTDMPIPEFKNLDEAATFYETNRTGRCELRSLVAYKKLAGAPSPHADYRKSVRIISNHVHAYIEIKHDKRTHKVDLGGYEATLSEMKLPPATLTPETTVSEKIISSQKEIDIAQIAQPTSSLEEKSSSTLESEIKKSSANPIYPGLTASAVLAVGESDVTLQQFFQQLVQNVGFQSHAIFYTKRPEDISLNGVTIAPQGKVKLDHTMLKEWLAKHSSGIIFVDIRQFNPSEIAQLNDLLDRKLDSQTVPSKIKIILYDKPARGSYGPDFLARVPNKMTLPTNVGANALLATYIPASQANDVLEINLFDSVFWQRLVIGSWQLQQEKGETDFTFRWLKGKLLQHIEQHAEIKSVVFKNPPLSDPSFNIFLAELQGLLRLRWADQITDVPKAIHFSASTGYDWQALAANVTLNTMSENLQPYILSDSDLLSFIQDSRYAFAPDTGLLTSYSSYLSSANGSINVCCDPSLSPGSLAEFLTEAKKHGVAVNFTQPSLTYLPSASPLRLLMKYAGTNVVPGYASPHVLWELHDDVEFAARKILHENPSATRFDMCYLDATELGSYPISIDKIKDKFMATQRFSMEATLSDIIKKLTTGQTVILSGTVPVELYSALSALCIGMIDRKPFSGKLIMLTPPEEDDLAKALTGTDRPVYKHAVNEKIALLNTLLPTNLEMKEPLPNGNNQFVELEREALQRQLDCQLVNMNYSQDNELSDEELADQYDAVRLTNVEVALKINPWVMIEGPTGIGKTYFLHHVLPSTNTVFTRAEWLKQPAIYVLDESNFKSELGNEGKRAADRMKNIKEASPHILIEGKIHTLSPNNKAVLAFNPADYGAGRSAEGILKDSALVIEFTRLPDFYLRARIINPLLKTLLGDVAFPTKAIADPVINVYNWILKQQPEHALITPREIKAMVGLVISHIKHYPISDPIVLSQLATEIAYEVGKQVLADSPVVLAKFEAAGMAPTRRVMARAQPPSQYAQHQYETYFLINAVLKMRETNLNSGNTDLGLGGVFLEGGSQIGKTDFIKKIVAECRAKGMTVYEVSPSTSFKEKERIIRKATAEGAIIAAEEFNTSLWPNKLLNNSLMGLDEHGKPVTTPGFALLATQNPRSFAGRYEEDPAIRHRIFKLKLDWPVYKHNIALQTVPIDDKLVAEISSASEGGLFNILVVQQFRDICRRLALANPQQNYHLVLQLLTDYLSLASDQQSDPSTLANLLAKVKAHEQLHPLILVITQLIDSKQVPMDKIVKGLDLTLQLLLKPEGKNKNDYVRRIGELMQELSSAGTESVCQLVETSIQATEATKKVPVSARSSFWQRLTKSSSNKHNSEAKVVSPQPPTQKNNPKV